MVRTKVATVTGAMLLAGAALTTGIVVGSQTTTNEITVPESWPFSQAVECAPLNTTFDYDPCLMVKSYFDVGFGINLQRTPYFIKWKAANPGEYQRILDYMANNTEFMFTPAQTKTWFGNFVRDTISMCKAARCRSMQLPVIPTTAVPNDTQSPSQPQDVQ